MSNNSDTTQQSNPPLEPTQSDFKVSLYVRPGPSDGSDRYSDTVADNGQIYSYLYTGGNEDGGNVKVEFDKGGGPPARIQVSINRDSEGGIQRYSIDRIEFAGDSTKQFAWNGTSQPHVANIKNKNLSEATVKYTTWVLDKNNECLFPCDPLIKNVPRLF